MHSNVQNFVLHEAKGWKDVWVVTSPCAFLALFGSKKRASLSFFVHKICTRVG